MQRIKLLFTALRSLRSLGLVLLLGVFIIALSAASYLVVYDPIDDVYGSMLRLDHLKDEVEFYVLEQALYTGYYIDFYDEEYLQWAREAGDALTEALAYYVSEEDFIFPYEQMATTERMQELQAEQETFLVALTDAIGNEDDETVDLLWQSAEGGTVESMEHVTALMFSEQMALTASMQQVQERVQTAVTFGIGSLLVLPLLAIAAFGAASGMARPILALSTALTAWGGGQFRPELLEETARRKDCLGELARSIETLATERSTQDAALSQNLEELRKELHASRRRKIVFSTSKPR